jgi:hypothetical protein
MILTLIIIFFGFIGVLVFDLIFNFLEDYFE